MDVFNFLFQNSPKVTKILTITCGIISLMTWSELITPLYLYFNYDLIFRKFQIWRILTNFFYFGNFSLSLIFHLILFFRNSKYLEKSVFKGNSADYIHFLLINIIILSLIGPYSGIVFLSNSLSFSMTYYFGRKSKNTFVNFMGIFTMRAPYLPWFYLLFSYLLESDFKNDLLGMVVGHIYFYFKDIFPRIKKSGGLHLLETPELM
jgi:Derlin-2/3